MPCGTVPVHGGQAAPSRSRLAACRPLSVPESLFEELKRYVGFDAVDEAGLRALHPVVQPHFVSIADTFYQRILEHDGARKVLVEGESMVGRLKVSLVAWMERLFAGPWDEAYFELRSRIGRVHVRINMPQHYMFGAMNVMRRELNGEVDRAFLSQPAQLSTMQRALNKILDLELAIMLHTYREDLLSAQARSERLATFGQLVGSIGHELRNPLGVMESSLFILKGRMKEDERSQKHVDRIGEQLGIANQIITDLLDMIRDKPLSQRRLLLGEVLKQAAGAVQKPPGFRIALDGLGDGLEVDGDPGQLRQVFVNLIENGIHAAGEDGNITIAARAGPETISVSVEDSGPGVDEATQRRLFEPLITTKVKGVGLGLALVKRIVERHRGSIAYEPQSGGARFVVRLPRAL
jgi:two-component system sensor histidine kinase HydH